MSLKKKRRVIQIYIQFRVPISIVLSGIFTWGRKRKGIWNLKKKVKKKTKAREREGSNNQTSVATSLCFETL